MLTIETTRRTTEQPRDCGTCTRSYHEAFTLRIWPQNGWNTLLGAVRTKSSLPGDIRELLVCPVLIDPDAMLMELCRFFESLHEIERPTNGSITSTSAVTPDSLPFSSPSSGTSRVFLLPPPTARCRRFKPPLSGTAMR